MSRAAFPQSQAKENRLCPKRSENKAIVGRPGFTDFLGREMQTSAIVDELGRRRTCSLQYSLARAAPRVRDDIKAFMTGFPQGVFPDLKFLGARRNLNRRRRTTVVGRWEGGRETQHRPRLQRLPRRRAPRQPPAAKDAIPPEPTVPQNSRTERFVLGGSAYDDGVA